MSPDTVPSLRSILELAYFVATIVLALVGCAALYQLVFLKRSIDVAKEDIELRSKREAVTLAAERSEVFANEIIPKVHEHLQQMANAQVPIKKWELVDGKFEKSSIIDWSEAEGWFGRVKAANQTTPCIRMLNLLESFAMYFAEGAADEHVAFPAVGPVFCEYVNRLAPCLIFLRLHEPNIPSGPYQNIIALFGAWSSRMKKEELELQHSQISSALSGVHTSEIPPIGARRQ
jgi:hypothetical protein